MSANISRRRVIEGAIGAVGAAIGGPFLNLGRFNLFAWSDQEYTRRCVDLVQSSLQGGPALFEANEVDAALGFDRLRDRPGLEREGGLLEGR